MLGHGGNGRNVLGDSFGKRKLVRRSGDGMK